MSDKYDEMLTRLAAQEKDTKEIRKRLERLEQDTCASDDASKKLEADLNELEWRSRKFNLEIHGVSVYEGENLLAKVNSVASMIDVCALDAADVAAIHRLPCKFCKTPGRRHRQNRSCPNKYDSEVSNALKPSDQFIVQKLLRSAEYNRTIAFEDDSGFPTAPVNDLFPYSAFLVPRHEDTTSGMSTSLPSCRRTMEDSTRYKRRLPATLASKRSRFQPPSRSISWQNT
ncbi:hypothetical protein HPB51_027747 [Rhipicephalus microplus]|uniref:Uncharacterized protein n=1 Tax=Rhipicephalus microplus TaxID=6941 RepID=A0A9J6CZ24_RHIMP|nr:hypothetical protein HPB51_027747 [Rhipicephalus microplus]